MFPTNQEIRVLLLGHEQTGKTVLLNEFRRLFSSADHKHKHKEKDEEDEEETNQEYHPTTGTSVARGKLFGMRWCVTDIGGRPKQRLIWDNYFPDTLFIIWVCAPPVPPQLSPPPPSSAASSSSTTSQQQQQQQQTQEETLRQVMMKTELKCCPVVIVSHGSGGEEMKASMMEVIGRLPTDQQHEMIGFVISDQPHSNSNASTSTSTSETTKTRKGRGDEEMKRTTVLKMAEWMSEMTKHSPNVKQRKKLVKEAMKHL